MIDEESSSKQGNALIWVLKNLNLTDKKKEILFKTSK